MRDSPDNTRGAARLWFALTGEERLFLAGVLALALLGLTARYLHLRGQRAEPVAPPAAEETLP